MGQFPSMKAKLQRVMTSHQPPPFSSIEMTSTLPRTLASTGTGAGKRILLSLYELSDPIPLRKGG